MCFFTLVFGIVVVVAEVWDEGLLGILVRFWNNVVFAADVLNFGGSVTAAENSMKVYIMNDRNTKFTSPIKRLTL